MARPDQKPLPAAEDADSSMVAVLITLTEEEGEESDDTRSQE
jgi:hypothetical protein